MKFIGKLLYTLFLACLFMGTLVLIPVLLVYGMAGTYSGFGLALVCLAISVICQRKIGDMWPPLVKQ